MTLDSDSEMCVGLQKGQPFSAMVQQQDNIINNNNNNNDQYNRPACVRVWSSVQNKLSHVRGVSHSKGFRGYITTLDAKAS